MLWVASDPEIVGQSPMPNTPLEPVSVSTAHKYLAAIRAWHIAQGWPPPLAEDQMSQINWSLHGLENLQGVWHWQPICLPITLQMLRALKATLVLSEPFDACMWAMATCAFWGMMHFSEVSVNVRSAFSTKLHLSQKDALLSHDLDGKPCARLDLPLAKTACAGQSQSVFLVSQDSVCPLLGLRNCYKLIH